MPDSDSGGERDADRESTVCPLCAVGCRLAAGEGTRARGRPGPANPEGRLCRKGVRAFERSAGDRLTEPLVRREGNLVAVPWETAYERVVEGIERARETRGPDGLAFLGAPHCTNEENYLLGKLARSLGTNNVDNRARHCHVASARALEARLGWPATTNSLDDLRGAEVILAVGANPAQRQPVAFNSFVRPAVNDGATLVHLDPVGNETTRLADIHLAPVPGTDALVLTALAAGVLDRDGTDEAFVAERTTGFEGFAETLAAVDPGAAAERADVDSEALARVAGLVAGADRVAAVVGTGAEDEGGTTADALLNLLLLSGNFGRRGTGLHVFRGPPNEQGAIDAGCVPDRLPGHQPVTDAAARARVAAEWDVEVPAEPGKTATDLLASFGKSMQAAVVVGENPAVSKRDREWVQARLDALETLVVLELRESETTAHADVVLPAGAGLEKAGTVTNLDRQIQRLTPLVDLPGNARPDREILCEIARRLPSVEPAFDYESPGAVFAELARVAPTHAGAGDDDLAGGWRWPADQGVLYREAFATAEGRAPFVAVEHAGEPTADDEGLHLVAGGRAGDAGAVADRTVRLHPGDAADLGVAAGADVTVADGERAVTATAAVDDGVRRGTVYLHAAVADPFVRAGTETVTVSPQTGDSG